MKILLLTDVPPCQNLTAGLILDQLCRFLPKGSIACFAVVNPSLNARISSDLDWIPIEYTEKPREFAFRVLPNKFGSFTALINERYNSLVTKKIASKAVNFGQEFCPDIVWCVLQGQTMIRLALPVSKSLGVPLLTHVWDPPQWWMRANKIDSISSSLILKEFDVAIRSSDGCFTASWAMAQQYMRDYRTRTVPFISSIDSSFAFEPATNIHSGNDLIIGMAGQIYSVEEWNALITALEKVDWMICNRKVKIRLLGNKVRSDAKQDINIEFLGWKSQKETIKLMSEADILYCPYWFDKTFEDEARLSFPSKLTTYLAAGRPVLFHGPEYASPAQFLEENNAGLCCYSLETGKIIDSLVRLVSEPDLYAKLTHNGTAAFNKYLTLESMKKRFADFLQVEESFLVDVKS
ncbi:glycosyltransferase [Methanolobus sp. WCC5]|uniref:glycosyltransferase n=1 Tax=Methanolobus sp. WCC5 TaxID=3125785 RepID=UPI00324C956F